MRSCFGRLVAFVVLAVVAVGVIAVALKPSRSLAPSPAATPPEAAPDVPVKPTTAGDVERSVRGAVRTSGPVIEAVRYDGGVVFVSLFVKPEPIYSGDAMTNGSLEQIEYVLQDALQRSPLRWSAAEFVVYFDDAEKGGKRSVGLRARFLRGPVDGADFDAMDKADTLSSDVKSRPLARLAREFYYNPDLLTVQTKARAAAGNPSLFKDGGTP